MLVALTFDDGPNTITTIQILDVLRKYNIVASFFVCGKNITDDTKNVIKSAYDMGCEIDNHSYSHSVMTNLTNDEILTEIQETSKLVETITGTPTEFFRPPYIAFDDNMYNLIDLPFIQGYGANDWEDTVSIEDRYSKILEQVCDGCIILLHDMLGNIKTVQTIDILIPKLLNLGYQFVTVSELFRFKNVKPQKNIIYSKVE
ncbi:MAG: polysaccharide deacetylase family protein [Oscillospiraceae bacterium]